MNTPEERAAEVMRERFGAAHFDPDAYAAICRAMTAAIREAEAAMKERCAVEVGMIRDCRNRHYLKVLGVPELAFEEICAEAIDRIRKLE